MSWIKIKYNTYKIQREICNFKNKLSIYKELEDENLILSLIINDKMHSGINKYKIVVIDEILPPNVNNENYKSIEFENILMKISIPEIDYVTGYYKPIINEDNSLSKEKRFLGIKLILILFVKLKPYLNDVT